MALCAARPREDKARYCQGREVHATEDVLEATADSEASTREDHEPVEDLRDPVEELSDPFSRPARRHG